MPAPRDLGATFYKWKSKYGRREVSDARRLKALEDENRRLKRYWSSRCWTTRRSRTCSEKRLKPAARREAVMKVMDRQLSQWHACKLVGLDCSTLRYRRRRSDDSALRQRLRDLAAERRRFGYRRLGWLLAREGHALNHKKLYRLLPRRAAHGAPARRA